MNAVIEVSEVRQVMHAQPLNRLARFETRAHRFQIGAIGPDLLVTVHAGAGRGQTGRSRGLDRRVTVSTIDAVIADVMFVAELNWLLALDPLAGIPAGTIDFRGDPQSRQQNENGAEDCGSRQVVRAVTKNLWHRVGQAFLPVRTDWKVCPT